eukprot:1184548-Prorocentrum_minimum.AAC.10
MHSREAPTGTESADSSRWVAAGSLTAQPSPRVISRFISDVLPDISDYSIHVCICSLVGDSSILLRLIS